MTAPRLTLSVILALLLVFAASVAIAADAWPAKPVRLIVPFAPGGSNDIIGRMAAQQLGDRLGKQVIVDNRPGAGGLLGTEAVAKAAPDGYTLLIVSAAYAYNPYI
ncbi:MAG: tripartite tricarboxylate transporter substrate-binding protein, partial [Burkholderiales bacterium]